MIRAFALAVVAWFASTGTAPAATWSPQPTVIPSGAVATTLKSVACPAARFCVAVGTSGPTYDPGTALVERWNGATWVSDLVPAPSGVRSSALSDVACKSTSSCLAVGNAPTLSDATPAAFAERWDGSRWSLVPLAAPPGSRGLTLNGVSCATRRGCVAVGSAFVPNGHYTRPVPVAERWDGAAWTPQTTPDLGGFTASLDDVSCSAGDACTAVGFHVPPGGGQVPLVERWNGQAWAVQDTPAVPGALYPELSGVACPRARFCEAVGFAVDHGIAERWDGSSWSSEPLPGPFAGASQLLGVTCGPRGRCTAVGEMLASLTGTGTALTERRTPAGWRVEPTPLPAGGTFGRLLGVSCSGAGNCMSVGWWGIGLTGLRPLAERRWR